ncbi:hypothetical protein RND81_10G157400 [Saponaria officinalis]|uniref:DUF3615 domain-containing protein n=1 Tax=Saponaria officinalis TaxID=3572 RepID=A0AAW1I361_SAPOF
MRRKASKPKHDFLADPFPPGCEKVKERAVRFANTALSYLRERGQNFELVKPDLHQGATISGGARFHCNFKAKRANDPSAPVETFFAQLHYTRDRDHKLFFHKLKDLVAECCVSLGESDSLPKERDNRGCAFCSKYVHHPVDGCEGIEWGGRRR